MSFFDSLNRFVSGLLKPEVVKLRSCKNCYFCRKFPVCTQTSPPTRILTEYQAQGCLFYTVEQPVVTSEVEDLMREAKYLEAINQLIGFDNTLVMGASDDWLLVKTIVMENFDNKTMSKFTFTIKVCALGIGAIKVTATIDEEAEATIHESSGYSNTEWKEVTVNLAEVLTGSTVTIKIYLKSWDVAEQTWNEKFECFGDVMQRFIYEEL